MKTLLVTSEITYVPQNYLPLFEEVFRVAGRHIAGLVLLENFNLKVLRDAAAIGAVGATGISSHLFRNALTLRTRKRERLFEERGLEVIRARTMNDPALIDRIRAMGIDLVVNVRTRCIYKSEILAAPRLGCLNIHHGLLPDHRGTLCDLHALHESRPAGFTIHRMNEKIDAGRILLTKEVSPAGEKNFVRHLERAGRIEGIALGELLNEIAERDALPDGFENRSAKPIYTRNPDWKKIRAMKSAGMKV